MRELYVENGLREIPRLLGMIDRNQFSPTYGCLDRNYWHYKVVDFPSGMCQVGCLPLALVYSQKFPNNNFYKKQRIKELSLSAIKFMINSSHKDGSTDEFYPFERAFGATSLSLYTATESYLILKEKNKEIEDFFVKRGKWILNNDEPGKITNHQAMAALALLNVYFITRKKEFLNGAEDKIKNVLEWQDEEGWFLEYEGCDPGYVTLTIDFLSKYYKKRKDKNILKSIKGAVEFCSYFIHPDGSYGGEYGSRNTYHFYPHGFKIVGKEIPLATQITSKWLEGLKNQKNEFIEDDRYFIYDMANRFEAYLDYSKNRKEMVRRKDFRKYFENAKIIVIKKGKYYVVISLAKGGVLKIFKNKKHIYNDCGLIGALDNNKVIVTQLIDNYQISFNEKISVRGNFNSVDYTLPSLSKYMLFRSGLLTFGKSSRMGKVIKGGLIKKLILKKKREPIVFKRSFEIGNGVKIKDQIKLVGKENIKSLAIGSDQTIIHVPGTRYYQESVLFDWINLDRYIEELNKKRRIKIIRVIK